MANTVTAVALGGQPKVYDNVSTVQDIMDQLDLDSPSIKVNGQTAEAGTSLNDFSYVSFGEKVKGGNA